MKESIKTILLFLGLILSLIFAPSCTKEVYLFPDICLNGDCESQFRVIYKNQEIYPNINGYYEIDWDGLDYFQVKGQLSELNEYYINNGIPLIETKFDSDYWVVLNNIYFSVPMYSYLGWFNDQSLNTPISIGNHTYTMNDLIDLHPPLNIVGYQIPKYLCTDCPYAPTLVGTYSKYNYEPTQNIMLDNEMVGDTINLFIETIFNPEGGVWYSGYDEAVPKEVIETQIKVIVI
jgi:hypothetical protein